MNFYLQNSIFTFELFIDVLVFKISKTSSLMSLSRILSSSSVDCMYKKDIVCVGACTRIKKLLLLFFIARVDSERFLV